MVTTRVLAAFAGAVTLLLTAVVPQALASDLAQENPIHESATNELASTANAGDGEALRTPLQRALAEALALQDASSAADAPKVEFRTHVYSNGDGVPSANARQNAFPRPCPPPVTIPTWPCSEKFSRTMRRLLPDTLLGM